MFKPGDKIVHIRHGAGVVKKTQTMVFDGEDREYFCIDIDDQQRTILIPVENVDEEEIRLAITDLSIIEREMNTEPEELDDDYRTRQAAIRTKLKTAKPRLLVQALRDLAYLERTHKLTTTDTHIRDQVMDALVREMALMPSLTLSKARQKLRLLMDSAMNRHVDELAAEPT